MTVGQPHPVAPTSASWPDLKCRGRPWVLVLTLAVGCTAGPGASDTPGQTPRTSPTTTPTSTAETKSSPVSERAHAALVLVDGVTVRSGPGQSAAAVPCDANAGEPIRLSSDAVVWLLDEALVEAEGYSWRYVVVNATYPIASAPGEAPCHEVPTLVGWVATGPTDDPWLGPSPCPEVPTELDELRALAGEPLLALACFSRDSIAVEGFYSTLPEGIGFSCPGIEPDWLTCSLETLTSTADGPGIRVRVPPTLAMPPRGQRIVVTGHFDDPAAQTCLPADSAYVGELQAIFYCRTQFVIDAARPAS